MRIGMKVDLGFQEDDSFKKLLNSEKILFKLKEIGITAVESALGPGTNDELIQSHIERCQTEKMILSFHPYTEKTPYNILHFETNSENLCACFHKKVALFAQKAALMQNDDCVVTIHPGAGPATDRKVLIEKSIEFFLWFKKWCKINAPKVLIVAELQIAPNPDESIERIGDRFYELEEIVKRTEIDVCWDFGHGIMNHNRYGTKDVPENFLFPFIKHIHCHDVKDDDHEPLIFDNVPWKKYLALLISNHYEGTIVLEIPPRNFLKYDGYETLVFTVQALKQEIGAE